MDNHTLTNTYLSFPKQKYCAGEEIHCPPHIVLLCTSGAVLLSINQNHSEEGLLGLITPGLAFGSPTSTSRDYVAISLTEVVVHKLNLKELQKSPALALQVLPCMIATLKRSEEFLMVANQRSIEARLDAFLRLLGMKAGRRTDSGVLLDFRLTHRQIANAICATRVSVTRLISRYREEGFLIDNNQRLLLRSCDKFG